MMTVYTVNAYYNAGNNEIVFPAGILQAFLRQRRLTGREFGRHRLCHRP